MNEVEKAYLAGIIDGEGTVTLTKHHKNETPSPCVSISNNDLGLLRWIKIKVGGTIISKRKNKPHHNSSFVLSIRYDKAINFLNEIKGYLIIKKQQAGLITNEYKSVTHRAGKYSENMLIKKNKLVAKIRKLNQR